MMEFPRSSFKEELRIKDPYEWTMEGYELSINYVYPGIVEGEQPSRRYLRHAVRVSCKRIALAGYRLADALIEIYGRPKGFLEP